MRAGNLNHRITFQRRTEGTDAYGGTVYVWSDFKTVWADFKPLRGKDIIESSATQNQTTAIFYCRYLSGLTDDMRIVYDDKNYDIQAIIPIRGQKVEFEITAKTETNEG